MSDVRVLKDENGLWNKLTVEDRQMAFRALEDKARKTFADSSLLAETRLAAEKQVRALIEKSRSAAKISAQPAEPLP
jgi:hypothetical protein